MSVYKVKKGKTRRDIIEIKMGGRCSGSNTYLKRVIKGKVGFQNAPVTQCYYPKVDSTITHHKKLGSVYQTGTFRQMEVLESLYERTTETSSS